MRIFLLKEILTVWNLNYEIPGKLWNCYSVYAETKFEIKVKKDVTWLFTWNHFITCIYLIRYTKTSYFVLLDYTGVVGIQAEKPRGNPHEKYRGVPKGGVLKEVWYRSVIKGKYIYSYKGCKKYVFYSKYIIKYK